MSGPLDEAHLWSTVNRIADCGRHGLPSSVSIENVSRARKLTVLSNLHFFLSVFLHLLLVWSFHRALNALYTLMPQTSTHLQRLLSKLKKPAHHERLGGSVSCSRTLRHLVRRSRDRTSNNASTHCFVLFFPYRSNLMSKDGSPLTMLTVNVFSKPLANHVQH